MEANSESDLEPFDIILGKGLNNTLSVGDQYENISGLLAQKKPEEMTTISHIYG